MPEYKNTAGRSKNQNANKAFNTIRLTLFWAFLIFVGYIVITNLNGNTAKPEERTLTEVLTYAKEEKLEKIEIN